MARKEMLKNLKMPKASPAEEDAGIDLDKLRSEEDSETPEDEAAETPEEQAAEEKYGIEKHGDKSDGEHEDLSGCSDDDLIHEMKKRGLLEESEDSEDDAGEDMHKPADDAQSDNIPTHEAY